MNDLKIFRMVMGSPWFLLVFLIIPLFAVLNVTLHLNLPLAGITSLYLNNICLGLLIVLRFLCYLLGLKRRIRYGSSGRPQDEVALALPLSQARDAFEKIGFHFDRSGNYGEKRDLGYLGTVLLYGGLLAAVSLGVWDNLHQFSGTLLDSMGPPTKLFEMKSYPILRTGPLTPNTDSLPLMKVMRLYLPDKKYPSGAAEIAVLSQNGDEGGRKIVTPSDPLNYGDYDICLARLMFEPEILVLGKGRAPVLDKQLKLFPLGNKVGEFDFAGHVSSNGWDGDVYYQPENSRMRVALKRDGQRAIETTLTFQVDHQVTSGDYTLSIEKMGQWGEIHVVRRRHLLLIKIAVTVALLGALMRLLLRPQRVWLEPAYDWSNASGVGRQTRQLVAQLAKK